jgi:hypothetical protein
VYGEGFGINERAALSELGGRELEVRCGPREKSARPCWRPRLVTPHRMEAYGKNAMIGKRQDSSNRISFEKTGTYLECPFGSGVREHEQSFTEGASTSG